MPNDKLTPKQERFIAEYTVEYNGTQAAIAAGYAKKGAAVTAAKLLINPKVARALAKHQQKVEKNCGVNEEYVIDTVKECVERCMQRVPVMLPGKGTQAKDAEGNDIWRFDAMPALKGCEMLGKHIGMFTEKHALDDKTSELLERIYRGRERAARGSS